MSAGHHQDGWSRLRVRIEAGDLAGVAAAVRALDAEGRKALARDLKAYTEQRRERSFEDVSDDVSRQGWRRRAALHDALRVAGVGLLGGADATAAWFTRSWLQSWGWNAAMVPAALEAVAGRDPAWRGELAVRLARRLRTSGDNADRDAYELAERLIGSTGIDPPSGDGFVYNWAIALRWGDRPGGAADPRTLLDRVRKDPFLDALLPRLFEVDELTSSVLVVPPENDRGPRQPDLLGAIAALAAEGRVDRGLLLDRCLARFLRGGTATRLRAFVYLHELLDPTPDELADRVRDYARLLPDAPPAVAALAQAALRRLDDGGRLPLDTLVEASDAVLFRSDRKLVRAQLTWLAAAARRRHDRPDDLGRVLVAATTAFEQQGADVKERAVKLVLLHGGHTTESARAELRKAAATLPANLARQVLDGLGDQAEPAGTRRSGPPEPAGAETEPGGGAGAAAWRPPVPVPGAVVPRAVPPPIASPAELAEELASLTNDRPPEPAGYERVLAALVAFAHSDRERLPDAFAPVSGRLDPETVLDWASSGGTWWVREPFLLALAVEAARAPDRWRGAWPVIREKTAAATSAFAHDPHSSLSYPNPRPYRVLVRRLDELVSGLLAGPVPALVSAPTAVTGHIDPAVLAGRLADAEAAGWAPWPIDLELALLRLPREADPAAAGRASRLTSPAGRALAARLAAGPPPDPGFRRSVQVRQRDRWSRPSEVDRTRILARVDSAPDGQNDQNGQDIREPEQRRAGRLPAGAELAAHDAGGGEATLGPLLFSLPELPEYTPAVGDGWHHHWGRLYWPGLLPSHREVAAAHLLPMLGELRFGASEPATAQVLPLLAEADGPVGPVLAVALVQGLGAQRAADRAAGTDALVILARRGQLDGRALGLELAEAARDGVLMLNRAAPALRDAALSGAGAGVLDAAAVALPRLLPPAVERPPNRLADLVAVAADLADGGHPNTGQATAELRPALDAMVAKGGSSRLAAECRRLHAALGGS